MARTEQRDELRGPSPAVRALTPGQVLKRLFLGPPLASEEAGHQLLRKLLALPVFSSDALSSVAYATEEITLVLIAAGAASLRFVMPISIGIAALLVIVVVSYRQTVRAYPSGGGAYIVSHENLGEMPGLIAAAALLVDYVLTVSVSVAAGVAAVVSAAPSLASQSVWLSLVVIAFITIINLRGVKESGTFFAFPTYAFIVLVYITIVVGLVKCIGGCPAAATSHARITALHAVTLFLLLRAFSSGSTALTGVEAISNGVPAFRRPQARNAASTLAIMGTIAVTMFLGISFLAHALHVVPITPELKLQGFHDKTVVAQIAETVFGHGVMFFLVQTATALILFLAANTSYQDFPRLSSILARDRYMPRQFMNRGDRLVFSNGVVVLATLAAVLILVFDANVTRLIQLYVVGVFTSFTLSQSGMVKHWLHNKQDPTWRRSAIINGIGAVATCIVLVVVVLTKFLHGAYIVVGSVPLIVLGFKAINRHYGSVAVQLRQPADRPAVATGTAVVILVHEVNAATLRAIGYATSLRPAWIKAVHVGQDADTLRIAWQGVGTRVPLEMVPPHGDLAATVRSYLRSATIADDEFLTIIIPERLEGRGMRQMLRDRRILLLKASLLFEPRVVVTDVPDIPWRTGGAPSGGALRAETPGRNIGVVLVSAVHNATLRAVAYAQAIRPTEVRAVTFALDAMETEHIMAEWVDAGPQVPLEILESPFREVTRPLIRFIRSLRAHRPDTVVTVVLPEFVVKKWWHHFMHNQTALRIKAALLYEPGVVVTSVPFHLE